MYETSNQDCGVPTFMFRPKRLLCFAQTALTVWPKPPLYIKKELQVFHYNHYNPRHFRWLSHQTATLVVTAVLLAVVVVVVKA